VSIDPYDVVESVCALFLTKPIFDYPDGTIQPASGRIGLRAPAGVGRQRIPVSLVADHETPPYGDVVDITVNVSVDECVEDSANSRPFSPDGVYPRGSIQAGGGSWAGRGGP
jgi:hypothetical protein